MVSSQEGTFKARAMALWSLLQETPVSPSVINKRSRQETESPGFNRIRCPHCQWQPKPSHRWLCAPCDDPEYFANGCWTSWNTFSTRGRCPTCNHQWRWTVCLNCQQWALHEEWYQPSKNQPA